MSAGCKRIPALPSRAGGVTTPVLWRAESSIRMERMASALVTASKEVDHFFREVSYCSYPRFDTERDVPDVETNNWRAVCGKPTARFGGRGGESFPYPYHNVDRTSFLMTRDTSGSATQANGAAKYSCTDSIRMLE